jgi:hypothetical protein
MNYFSVRIVDMSGRSQRQPTNVQDRAKELRNYLTKLGISSHNVNAQIQRFKTHYSTAPNKKALLNNFKTAANNWKKAVNQRKAAAKKRKRSAVASSTSANVANSTTERGKRKTAVRPKTIVPKNALSTQQKKLIDQLDTLVGEMTRGNRDLHDFIISFYDETSNNEFTMKLFGGKSISEAKQIIQKHINLFSRDLLRGSEVKEKFELKGDDVINFAYLMFLDMKHDATIPTSMTFEQYCKASWVQGGKQVRSPVYIMFGRELTPKLTEFIKKIENIVNNATNTNGKKYGSMEKAIKYNLPTIYQDIPDMFKGISVAYAQINENFLKGGNNLFLALDQEDEKHTATLNISRTRYNLPNGSKAKLLYPFVSVANLLDPGKNMLIDSAKEDSKYLMNAVTSNSSVVGNTAANRITSRLTWNYYKPKFVIKHDYGETVIDVYYTKQAGPKRDKRGYAVGVLNPGSREPYRLEAKVSKDKASRGTSADKLSKFFGDFLQALSTINQIKKNKVRNHNFCLTTGDAMLANMFVFMCSHGSPRPVTPKLWLVLSKNQRSFLYGMNDIVQVANAAPTRVINVPNTTQEATSGSNRSNSNNRQRNVTPIRTSNVSNNGREGSGNSSNVNARPGFFGRVARLFGGNKKQSAKSNSTRSPKFKPQTPKSTNNRNVVMNNVNNNNTRSFVTASSNNSKNNNNVTSKKRKVNNNVRAKLNELERMKRRERELAKLKN